MLEPFAEMFRNLAEPSNPLYHSKKYRQYLDSLEDRFDKLLDDPKLSGILPTIGYDGSQPRNIVDLFRLGALVSS